MYKLIRHILFLFPTEQVHHFSMACLRLVCRTALGQSVIRRLFVPRVSGSSVACWNLTFRNRVGLAAGFDKNARYLDELDCLGFGFVEIGTVTPLPQPGNDRPRLFRLPADKALINRMGFNNDGVNVVATRLQAWQDARAGKKNGARMIVGGNIGKNKLTPNEEAWKDYEICFQALHPYVDYFVVNVSSPNTPGLRELQEKESLGKILRHLQMINNGKANPKPILLKIAPDLTPEQVDDVVELALGIRLDGLVAANTTISRAGLTTAVEKVSRIGAGGLSGAPLRTASTDLVRYLHEKTGGQVPIIASGGIFTGSDASEKLAAGAALVQVWTGFIYEGPSIVKRIVKHLL